MHARMNACTEKHMTKFDSDAQYFRPADVLECGQIFRFEPFREGYRVFSADKDCYVHTDGAKTTVESEYPDYFYNFFDLARDYSAIIKRAESFGIPALSEACEKAKGLRLLNQNKEEMIYSFIISQNNNIPRIKGIISRICEGLGQKIDSPFGEFHAFPSSAALASRGPEYYKALGAGYRDAFISLTAKRIAAEGIAKLEGLERDELKAALLTYRGIGPKVADCICLFGFGRRDAFPVDTWIEKLYREDFGGTLTDRKKINAYFTSLFGEFSGYVQQYLFYAKRSNL